MQISLKPLLLLLLLTLTGCASVSMVASWKDQTAPPRSYGKFLVVGITENGLMRQLFEEVVATELRKKGLAATPSYAVTGMEEKQTRESLERAVRKSAVDAVITTRVTGSKRSTESHVGYVLTDRGFANPYLNSYDVMPNDLYGFYGASVVSYATFDMKPVEVTNSTTFTLETNLFDTESGKLVWSGTTTTVDPKGVITASEKFSRVVITALSKEGLIP